MQYAGARELLFTAMYGTLIAAASLVSERGLYVPGLQMYGARV